jgi:hypothetical protein
VTTKQPPVSPLPTVTRPDQERRVWACNLIHRLGLQAYAERTAAPPIPETTKEPVR